MMSTRITKGGKSRVNLFCTVMIICAAILLTSCDEEDNPVTPVNPPITEAYIIGKASYPNYSKLTNYNFLYPSKGPYGNTVMLSGTISMGPEVVKGKPARGLVLYNHYSIFQAEECASKGKLDIQDKVRGSGLIVISPDSYGFGSTENQQQAYCMASQNAQASVDALIAAKQLLAQEGYQYDDVFINIGYSQGAQTAIGVLKLTTEKYPYIRFTRTLAGAGPYDLTETYRQLIGENKAGMSSNAVSVLLAYNEFSHLGFQRSELFRDPLLSHIDDWILSKKYKRQEIDDLIGKGKLTDCLTPDLSNLESSVAQRFMEAFECDNLCKGWTPRKDENILLFHSSLDQTVPPSNTTLLYQFLTEQGVENIELDEGKYGIIYEEDPHSFAALTFISHVKEWMCNYLGIPEW